MPDAALNAYLAKNYLDGAKAEALLARSGALPDEKRKRKKKKVNDEREASSKGGLKLVDENDETWRRRRDSDEEAVTIFNEADKERKRKGKWNRMGGQEAQANDEVKEDEKPQMASEDGLGLDSNTQAAVEKKLEEQGTETHSEKKPSIRAGLKTKEEMRAERLERERMAAAREGENKRSNTEEQEFEKRRREREERAQETVYRDASGRRIDTIREGEERRIAKEEERQREREKKDWNKGQVQLERARHAKRREEEERTTSFARYSNDERMNKELRDVQRAADPALGFLAKRTVTKGPQKPSYKGSFPPNRFNIRPGYRWDGVERSNGFEAKFFQKKHQRAHKNEEMDAWGKEDM